ncbi:hypothetical protein [Desertibacillus haloalkaliphilus]|uniref:hypothetical protein n=1 Tax=Desertibacillus haloalkaliphilus TaxID=1328930 RepID=UPI001C270BF7|nr:hypothetical protein [Desertibacillus haloalkaliphilus]MBU8906377.1 hypothetical protein [Desertibacillus haloalkaliphilus]
MMERKVEQIEGYLNRLEKMIVDTKKDLESQIVNLTKEQQDSQKDPHPQKMELDSMRSLQLKVDYLTAANEQMFQQNQRLREFIQESLESGEVPTKEGYVRALRGDF